MARALDIKSTRKFSFALKLLHQVQNLLARTTDGGHARSCIHSGLNITIQCFDIRCGHLHHGHSPLVFWGQRGFAFTHQARAVAGNQQSIFIFESTSSVSSSDFAHGHAHDTRWTHTEVR